MKYYADKTLPELLAESSGHNERVQEWNRKMTEGLKLVYTHERPYYEDSYGTREYYQDGDNTIYRIYQLDGGERHFKQTGTQSSYESGVFWNDDFEEVTPALKKITTYDYEGY